MAEQGPEITIRSTDEILEEVSVASIQLMIDEVFFGHFFQGLLKEVHKRVSTMAIGPSGNHIKLHINPVFWSTQLTSSDLRKGLIKHEILHVVFRHIFRSKDFRHKDIFNIACDLVVNQYIQPGWLPDNRIHLDLFPDLELEEDEDADYYYRKLLDLYEKHMDGSDSGETAEGDSQQGGGGSGSGQGGSSSENQGDFTDEEDDDSESDEGAGGGDGEVGSESWDNLKRILGEDEWKQKHELWEDIEDLPTSIRNILEQGVEQAIVNSRDKAQAGDGWGKIPGGFRSYLEQFQVTQVPAVNWRQLLRIFTESSSKTRIRNTLKRPSRRYGTTPGIKIRRKHKLVVAVDTSGSVSEKDLEEFFNEIYHIWKRGAEIMVVECDAAIGKTYLYKGRAPVEIHGRGGTNFNPPIRWANQHFHPDALIYFTDGWAPPPEDLPRYPLLWLICSTGVEPGSEFWEKLPGKRIRMSPLESRRS